MNGFRDFVLKENPDELSPATKSILDIKNSLRLLEGLTFTLFDGYYLFSKEGQWIIHETIGMRVSECYRAIEAAVNQEISFDELDQCITSPQPGTGVVFLESKGKINSKTIEQMIKTVDIMKIKKQKESESTKPVFVAYRNVSLKTLPNVILGRVWKKNKVISFWNDSNSVFNAKKDIFEFLSNFGQPSEYYYEVENQAIDYGDFLKRNIGTNKSFDSTIMHTMPPGELKQQLQSAMGMKKFNPRFVDIKTRQKASTSENHNV